MLGNFKNGKNKISQSFCKYTQNPFSSLLNNSPYQIGNTQSMQEFSISPITIPELGS